MKATTKSMLKMVLAGIGVIVMEAQATKTLYNTEIPYDVRYRAAESYKKDSAKFAKTLADSASVYKKNKKKA